MKSEDSVIAEHLNTFGGPVLVEHAASDLVLLTKLAIDGRLVFWLPWAVWISRRAGLIWQ